MRRLFISEKTVFERRESFQGRSLALNQESEKSLPNSCDLERTLECFDSGNEVFLKKEQLVEASSNYSLHWRSAAVHCRVWPPPIKMLKAQDDPSLLHGYELPAPDNEGSCVDSRALKEHFHLETAWDRLKSEELAYQRLAPPLLTKNEGSSTTDFKHHDLPLLMICTQIELGSSAEAGMNGIHVESIVTEQNNIQWKSVPDMSRIPSPDPPVGAEDLNQASRPNSTTVEIHSNSHLQVHGRPVYFSNALDTAICNQLQDCAKFPLSFQVADLLNVNAGGEKSNSADKTCRTWMRVDSKEITETQSESAEMLSENLLLESVALSKASNDEKALEMHPSEAISPRSQQKIDYEALDCDG